MLFYLQHIPLSLLTVLFHNASGCFGCFLTTQLRSVVVQTP